MLHLPYIHVSTNLKEMRGIERMKEWFSRGKEEEDMERMRQKSRFERLKKK